MIFAGSYFPLSLILAVKDFNWAKYDATLWDDLLSLSSIGKLPFDNPLYSVGAVSLCCVCMFITWIALSVRHKGVPIDIREAAHRPTELINYTIPYIVSFMGIDYGDADQVLGFSIFLLWMFILTQSSGQVIFNPVLIVFRWKLYEISFNYVDDQHTHSGVALSRFDVQPGIRVMKTEMQRVLLLKQRELKGDKDG